jgi:hypothetical protein
MTLGEGNEAVSEIAAATFVAIRAADWSGDRGSVSDPRFMKEGSLQICRRVF